MRRLLVTGASGFLGWNVCRRAPEHGWAVVGVVNAHRIAIPDVDIRACDLRDSARLTKLFDDVKPSGVIHLAAMAQPNECERDPAGTCSLNVDVAVAVAERCARDGIGLAFTSTDLVFDGSRAPYRENNEVAPINEYGRQKAEAERRILACRDAAVCRMPLMYGEGGPAARGSTGAWRETLAAGRELKLFVDEYRTPVSGRDAAEGLLLALERTHGLIHLGGRQRTSRYEFGLLLARAGNWDERLIVPCRQADVVMPAARPADVSLDSSRAFTQLGYNPGTIADELRDLFCQD